MRTSDKNGAAERIVSCLPDGCEVVRPEQITAQALAAWYREKKQKHPDKTPLILRLDDVLAQQLEYVAKESDAPTLVQRADAIYAERYRGEAEQDVGDIADERVFKEIAQIAQMCGEPLGLALLPTPRAWEALCYVPIGGFNDCPPSEELAAQFRHWQNAYRAVPLLLFYDSVFLMHEPTKETDLHAFAAELLELCECYGDAFPDEQILTEELEKGELINLWWD